MVFYQERHCGRWRWLLEEKEKSDVEGVQLWLHRVPDSCYGQGGWHHLRYCWKIILGEKSRAKIEGVNRCKAILANDKIHLLSDDVRISRLELIEIIIERTASAIADPSLGYFGMLGLERSRFGFAWLEISQIGAEVKGSRNASPAEGCGSNSKGLCNRLKYPQGGWRWRA